MGLWVLGALNAALNGNVLAELGTAIPKSGGVYNYAQRAFGDVGGLIIGWANWLAFVAGTGAAAISFANFMPLIWPWAAQHTVGVAVAMLIGLFGANIPGLARRPCAAGSHEPHQGHDAGDLLCCGRSLCADVPAAAARRRGCADARMGCYDRRLSDVRGAYAGWDTPFYFGEEVVDAGTCCRARCISAWR